MSTQVTEHVQVSSLVVIDSPTGGGGITDHSQLQSLGFAESGHTGFAPAPPTGPGIVKVTAGGLFELAVPGTDYEAPGGAGSVNEASLLLADNVTGNVSVLRHGFVPKLPNDAAKFFNGAGGYTVVTADFASQVTSKPTTLAGYGITDAATTAYVDAAVASFVGAAPDTLNALNELAAALGDDPNFAATMATQLGTKVAANTAIVPGTGTKVTVDAKGLVTAIENPTTLAGYGITDAMSTSVADDVDFNGHILDNYSDKCTDLVASDAIAISLADGAVQTLIPTEDFGIALPAPVAGKSFSLTLIIEVGDTPYTLSQAILNCKWMSEKPVLAANEVTILSFFSNSTGWFGFAAQQVV